MLTPDSYLLQQRAELWELGCNPVDELVAKPPSPLELRLRRVPFRGRRQEDCEHVLVAADESLPESLCIAAKVVAAIVPLEELQHFHAAEVANLWAWTVDVFNVEGHDAGVNAPCSCCIKSMESDT